MKKKKIQTQVCPHCHKTFKRRPTETLAEWRNRKYCTRTCQYRKGAERAGKKNVNLLTVQLWDACTGYMVEAQERLMDQVKVYDSKNMSQEELRRLVEECR
jgi:hypothetical protein